MVTRFFKRRFYQGHSIDMGGIKIPYEIKTDYKPVVERDI